MNSAYRQHAETSCRNNLALFPARRHVGISLKAVDHRLALLDRFSADFFRQGTDCVKPSDSVKKSDTKASVSGSEAHLVPDIHGFLP